LGSSPQNPTDPSLEGDPPEDKENELRFKAKMRAVDQSARCAGQPRKGGAFGKAKKQPNKAKKRPVELPTSDGLPTSDADVAQLTAFLAQLDLEYKAVVQHALDQASSQLLHQIQSSADALPDERHQAELLWQQATASVQQSMEMVVLPTLSAAVNNQPAPLPKSNKRARVIPGSVSSHKADRRLAYSHHEDDHGPRDGARTENRAERSMRGLAEDTAIAFELQKTVKDELHYSERRLIAISAYYQARASGMSKTEASKDAARSMSIGKRTMERWVSKYLSEGEGFFRSCRWGAHSKTPYLLADKSLQKVATMWIREHAAQKKDAHGNAIPNMKVEDFQDYLNSALIPRFVSEWGDTVDFRQSIVRRNANANTAPAGSNTNAAPARNGTDAAVPENADAAAPRNADAAVAENGMAATPPENEDANAARPSAQVQSMQDAHVQLMHEHQRSQSLKAAQRKEQSATLVGKEVQYVSRSAAKSYLHRLGFNVVRKGKHSFVDGHERDDVLASRAQFLQDYFDFYDNGLNYVKINGAYVDKDQIIAQDLDTYNSLQSEDFVQLPEDRRPKMVASNGRPALAGKIPIFCYQDESTFRVNDKERWQWSDGSAECSSA
jgi:hypothetical protein